MKLICILIVFLPGILLGKFSKYNVYGDDNYDSSEYSNNEEKDDLVSNALEKYSNKFLLDPINSNKKENSRELPTNNNNNDFESKLKGISQIFNKVTPDKYIKLYNDLLGVYSNLKKSKKTGMNTDSQSPISQEDELEQLKKKWNINKKKDSPDTIEIENNKEKQTFNSDSSEDNEVKININLKNQNKDNEKKDELNEKHFAQSLETVKKLIEVFVEERKSEEKLLDDLKKNSQGELTKFSNDLETLNEDQEELEKQKDELTKEAEESKNVYDTLKEKKEELQTEINHILSDSKITVQDSGILTSNITQPMKKLKESDTNLLRLKRDHMKLSNFKTLAMDTFKNIEQKRKEAIVVEEKLKKKLDSLTSDLDNSHSELESKRKSKEKLEKDIQELKTQIQAKDTEISSISSNSKTTDDSRFKEVDEIQKNQKNYQDLSKSIEDLEKKLKDKKFMVQEKETEIEVSKRTQEKDLDELQLQLESLKSKGNEELKGKREKLREQSKKLKDLSVEQGRALEDARLNLNSLLINNYSKIKH